MYHGYGSRLFIIYCYYVAIIKFWISEKFRPISYLSLPPSVLGAALIDDPKFILVNFFYKSQQIPSFQFPVSKILLCNKSLHVINLD